MYYCILVMFFRQHISAASFAWHLQTTRLLQEEKSSNNWLVAGPPNHQQPGGRRGVSQTQIKAASFSPAVRSPFRSWTMEVCQDEPRNANKLWTRSTRATKSTQAPSQMWGKLFVEPCFILSSSCRDCSAGSVRSGKDEANKALLYKIRPLWQKIAIGTVFVLVTNPAEGWKLDEANKTFWSASSIFHHFPSCKEKGSGNTKG